MPRHSLLRPAAGAVCAAAMLIGFSTGLAAADGLVGKTFPPYPDGFVELQGACVTGAAPGGQVCDYGLLVLGKPAVDAQEPIPVQLLASRNIEPGATTARWRVVDAVTVPKPRKGYGLQIASCRIDGVDAAVVAFVRHNDRDEYSRDVRWARHFDVVSGKLLPIASKRIDCVNEGFGV